MLNLILTLKAALFENSFSLVASHARDLVRGTYKTSPIALIMRH